MKPIDGIILPFHDWKKNETEGFRSRDGHLTSHFLASERVGKVLVVDRPISFIERVMYQRPLRCVSGCEIDREGRAILSEIERGLYVLDSSAPDLVGPLRLRRDWWDVAFRRARVWESIRWAARRAGLAPQRCVLLCWSPLSTGCFGKCEEALIAFDAIDNWCDHPVMTDRRGWIRRGYERAIKDAGVLTCNNPNTANFLESLGRRPRVIRNGVDLDRWDPEAWADTPVPKDLAAIPKPWLGYAGRLAPRTDVDLICRLARQRPDWSIVLVGPMMDRVWHRPLFDLPNVYFVGDKAYSDLPRYVARFDVACVFHGLNAVKNMDPTKIYEYLALGLPVVTTPVEGAETFAKFLHVASDADAFESAVAHALQRAESNPSRISECRAALEAEGFSWRVRADELLDEIEYALDRVPARRPSD